MRDDIDKLPLSKKAKKYARLTSADLGSNWSAKEDLFIDVAAELTHQSKEGFPNRDACGPVPHAMKENSLASVVVARLMEGLYNDTGAYEFITSCVGSTAEKIHALLDTEVDVSKAEFFRNVPLREIFASGIGHIYYWTRQQCATAGVDYEEVKNNGLKMWKDWAISYYKGIYEGLPCYFFKHSAIEYIFVKP